MKQAPAGYGGVADGGGTEFTLRETAPPIPYLRIDPLDQ